MNPGLDHTHHARRPLPLQDAAELQDELLSACNDLDRLQGLLAGAFGELSQGLHGAIGLLQPRLDAGAHDSELLAQIKRRLSASLMALQFEDLATQLIAHTRQRLRQRADRVAQEAFGTDDSDGEAVVENAPQRPNPVTQDEMDAGSVELF